MTATHRARIIAAFDAGTGERPKGLRPVSAVAADLGLELPTVLAWIETGKVAGKRIGDRVTLVNYEEVAAFATVHPPRHRQPTAESRS